MKTYFFSLIILAFYIFIVKEEAKAQNINFKTIEEALSQPWGKIFAIERVSGQYTMADTFSHYNTNTNFRHLTYDISNNKVLANMGIQGKLLNVSVYRDSYFAGCNPKGWSGVWTAKDNSSFGPYTFSIELEDKKYKLDTVNWDFRTGLLDNIFPITELREPGGKCKITIVAFAPVSKDGQNRIRGLIYGLLLENTSNKIMSGKIMLPAMFSKKISWDWASMEPYDFEQYLADSDSAKREISFTLNKGKTVWVPVVFSMLGDNTREYIRQHGSLACLNSTWNYFRSMLGILQTPNNEYLGEFYERQIMEAYGALAMSASDKFAGSNWGSYPTTRQIWIKDCYYSSMPFMANEPQLAKAIILWFTDNSVRPKGTIREGGVTHSIGLSVAGIMLGAMYYKQTGDRQFFNEHPELKTKWGNILEELLATAKFKDVWLFKSSYISDGKVDADYHTGSNVCMWYALKEYARMLDEVYNQKELSTKYHQFADNVHNSILEKNIINGPYGKQFIEGTFADDRKPVLSSDGEESDVTLMPFYNFTPYDDSTYVRYMKFSMSPDNAIYNPGLYAIKWDYVPSTAPGYLKGLCSSASSNGLFGQHGYYNEIRRITDADGSIWWWSYGEKNVPYGKVERGIPGKAGWFSGAYATIFVNRFLGITFDATSDSFLFTPLPVIGNFSWKNFPIGNQHFSVSCTYEKTKVFASFQNHNNTAKYLSICLSVSNLGNNYKIIVNGKPAINVLKAKYLGNDVIKLNIDVAAYELIDIQITKK